MFDLERKQNLLFWCSEMFYVCYFFLMLFALEHGRLMMGLPSVCSVSHKLIVKMHWWSLAACWNCDVGKNVWQVCVTLSAWEGQLWPDSMPITTHFCLCILGSVLLSRNDIFDPWIIFFLLYIFLYNSWKPILKVAAHSCLCTMCLSWAECQERN